PSCPPTTWVTPRSPTWPATCAPPGPASASWNCTTRCWRTAHRRPGCCAPCCSRYRVPPRSRAACPSRKAGQADPVRASGYAGVRRVRACRVEPECGGAVGQASELPQPPQHRRGAVEADPAGGGAGGAGEGAQAGDVDEPEPGHVDGAVAKGGDGADRGLECVAGADVDLAGQ